MAEIKTKPEFKQLQFPFELCEWKMTAFARFDPMLQEKIVHRLGWTGLRPVQEMAAEAVLDGCNCVVLAPTAGGKTEAAMFPVLSGCLTNQELGLRALYICPTRALINNQEQRLGEYAEMLGMGAFKWHGDVTPAAKKKFLRDPCEILITTPESIEVMLISPNVPPAKLFKHLRYVVVDEAHALASYDRGDHLISVLERVRAYCGNDFQRIALSATVGNPEQILEWLQGSSKNPQKQVDPPKQPGKKRIEIRMADEPGLLASQAARAARGGKSLLFCESRALAETIAGAMKRTECPVYVHHSSLSREEREDSEHEFHLGGDACIVCTATLELGIDVGDLDKVLQVDCPGTVSSFLQRLGRTGRRQGAEANTAFFVQDDSRLLQAIAVVELARNNFIESVYPRNRVWHILLHQIMAMCLERGAVTADMLWERLRPAYCFSGIRREEFDRFVQFLLNEGFLHDDGRDWSLGLKAETTFGRKNFMDIYSVFSAPLEFQVIGLAGDVIGAVQWDFLEKLLEDGSAFYLAGRAWQVEGIDWKKKTVKVAPAPSGKIPKWGGITPKFLSFPLCRKMRDILAGSEEYPYLDPKSRNRLAAMREDNRELLNRAYAPIEHDDKGFIWHTWAGGRINHTIRTVFKIELNADARAGNEYVRVNCDSSTAGIYLETIERMADPAYWENPELLKKINALAPNYRLSKFQPYLPDPLRLQFIAGSVFDVDGTLAFLRRSRTKSG